MTTLRRIGGANAITVWSYVLSMVVLLVVTVIPSERDQFIGTLGQRIVLAGVGTLAGFLVLGLASASVLRTGSRGPRPGTAIVVFALAGVAQALAIVGLRDAMGLAPVAPVALVVTRAIAGVLWLAVIAIVVDQIRSHGSRVAELRDRISAMEGALAEEEHQMRADAERMRDQVLAPLRTALDDIAARLDARDTSRAADEARALRRLVDEQVRPMSHELLAEAPLEAELAGGAAPHTRGERLRTVWRLAVTDVAAPTWLAVVLPMALILLFAIQEIGLIFLLAAGCSYIVVVGILFGGARRLLAPRLPAMSTTRATVTVLVAYEAIAIAAVVNGWAWGGLSAIGAWVEWPALITLPVIWLTLATITAAERERRSVEDELEAVLDALHTIVARRRQQIRHERQVLGRLLHGSAQSTLLSVASRLATADGAPDRGDVMEEAAAELAALRARLAMPVSEDWRARAALDDLFAVWSGVLDVDLRVPHGLLARLDGAPASRTGVIDIVAEGLTNAARHGGARNVVVEMAEDGQDRIAVVITDDGSGPAFARRGMGSEILDEAASEWSLDAGPTGSVLRAVVVG